MTPDPMKRIVYKRRFLSIERGTSTVRGKKVETFREIRPDVVVVVPQLRDGRFIVERQYRHSIKKPLYEFAAGHIEKGETPKASAIRELEEETGYHAKKITPMSELYWTPGSSPQRFFFFHAVVEKKGKKHLDETEVISLVRMSATTLEKLVHSGRICDGKTVLGFLLCSNYFAKKQ